MCINLETERLILRPIVLNDAAFIIDLVNSKGWLKFIGDRNITNKKDAENYIQGILDNSNYHYTIFELKNSGKAIGINTFLKREDEKFPDLGFAILPQFEKNGYAFEASTIYLEEIKKLNTYENIIAITHPDNKNSIHLLLKLGFHLSLTHHKIESPLLYYSLK